MKTVTCKDGKFVFMDGEKRIELLDIYHFMVNKSRYPMQLSPEGKNGIPRLIIDLMDQYRKAGGDKEEAFSMYLLDIIMTSYLIRTSAPLKVLEIGATNGTISYHLATLMGKLNRESLLYCVSNVIGNNSANCWLDRISMVEEPPNLSMLASDYESTQLETANFDIVVLNGTVRFDKTYETIREAERLVKRNGVLVCYAKNAPLLESSFKLIFSDRQEYEISPQEMIMVVNNPESSWKKEKMPALEDEVSKILLKLQQIVRPGCHPEEIKPFIYKIDLCVDMAIKDLDIDRKVELIQLKGMMFDYMLNIGKEFEDYDRNVLLDYLNLKQQGKQE